jgi:hypothetical protein
MMPIMAGIKINKNRMLKRKSPVMVESTDLKNVIES